MGYRPFGKYGQVGAYPVGDQWPAPPEDVQGSVDGPLAEGDFNRFERAIYRWLARPRLFRRSRKRPS